MDDKISQDKKKAKSNSELGKELEEKKKPEEEQYFNKLSEKDIYEKTLQEEKQKLVEILEKMENQEQEIEQLFSKSNGYDLEHIAEANVMEAQIKKLSDIKKLKDKPYFARMDFREKQKKLEAFYIGKMSLLDSKTAYPIIVDWRAPIANLYYEGKIGPSSYECLGEQIEGDILLKRQYIIENKELLKHIDINVTGNDELLQDALEEKADDRLKNIVATIQDEQNKIIRADLNSPLIVQGVAGSRKNNNSSAQNCIPNIQL